jgi:hypothetical protein
MPPRSGQRMTALQGLYHPRSRHRLLADARVPGAAVESRVSRARGAGDLSPEFEVNLELD